MLQTIREHTQGWIAGTIISVIIFSFAFWGIHSYFTGDTASNTVAEVSGVAISHSQLSSAYERLRRQQFNNTSKDEVGLKKRALEALIELEVLKQASIAQGFDAANNQIDSYIQSMPEFQVNGRFSLERFEELLASSMLSTSEFLELVRSSLLIDQPKLGILLTSFALTDETNATIALVNQERDIDYVILPMQYFLSQHYAIPAEQIKKYYQTHQQEFMSPEQTSINYLQVTLDDIAAKMAPTDAMLKNYYNDNINAYTQPMSWKLNKLLVPLAETADDKTIKQIQAQAEQVAKALSNGEDVNKIAAQFHAKLTTETTALDQLPVALQPAVTALNKPQQVSAPIKTNEGFVIVKVLEFNGPVIQPFESVKDKVKTAYIRQHAEEKFAEVREQLANATYEHSDSLEFAAKNLNLPIKSSELFSKDKSGKDISQYKKVRDVAFSNDVINLQNNSDVIQINPDTMIVLRTNTHVASHLLTLKDVTPQIENKLQTQDAEARAAKLAQEIQNKLLTSNNLAAITSQYKLTWIKTGPIGRYSKKVDAAILDKAFSLSDPATNAGNDVYGVTRLANGYAIIALRSVKPGKIENAKQKAIFDEQVQNSDGVLEYQLYKNSLLKSAKIKLYQS